MPAVVMTTAWPAATSSSGAIWNSSDSTFVGERNGSETIAATTTASAEISVMNSAGLSPARVVVPSGVERRAVAWVSALITPPRLQGS